MPVVFTPDSKGSGASPIAIAGGVWMLFGTLTFSGSYATNGDALDLSKFVPAMGTVRQVTPIGQAKGLTFTYDVVNKKLLVWTAPVANAPTEHTAAAYNAALTVAPQPISFLIK